MKDLIVPKPTSLAQQPQPQKFISSSLIEGIAFGGGSSIAHSFIGRLFSRKSESNAEDKKTQYTHCLEITKNNYEACEHLQM